MVATIVAKEKKEKKGLAEDGGNDCSQRDEPLSREREGVGAFFTGKALSILTQVPQFY